MTDAQLKESSVKVGHELKHTCTTIHLTVHVYIIVYRIDAEQGTASQQSNDDRQPLSSRSSNDDDANMSWDEFCRIILN